MTGIVITTLFLIAATRSTTSAPGGVVAPSGDTGAQRLVPRVTGAVHSGAADTQLPGRVTAKVAPETAAVSERVRTGESSRVSVTARSETCRSARVGLRFYRMRQRDWLKLRGGGSPQGQSLRSVPSRIGRKPHGCADARYLASVARERASIARRGYERWLERRTLRDFRVTPSSNAWLRAVREAQRAFPGTEAWLVSCSAAEGGHGRWVRYGGGSYYPGYEHTDAVGNWMQFRWSTFKGMYRRALEDLSSKNFRVPPMLREPGDVRAWLSPLATALAAGWARWSDNDDSHWSASFGSGCS